MRARVQQCTLTSNDRETELAAMVRSLSLPAFTQFRANKFMLG